MRLKVFDTIDEALALLSENNEFYHEIEREIEQYLIAVFKESSEMIIDINSRVKSRDSLREKIMEYMQQHPDVLLKRHELASFLGVSRPALSRELYRMVDDGLLVLDEHGSFKTVI